MNAVGASSLRGVANFVSPTTVSGSIEDCCATLYELPQTVGNLRAGTLLFAGSYYVNTSMAIEVYTSTDQGQTWNYLGTPVSGGSNTSPGHGLWEPQFEVADDGALVMFWSDRGGDWRNDPENSLQSLKRAAVLGVDIVEMDLKRTKDGQLVLMHDKTLDRTTTGSGPVSDHTLGELQSLTLRAGTHHCDLPGFTRLR
jgi:hypothetical protein